LHSNIFAASTSLSVSLFTRAKTSARRSSLVLIAVLFNRTSSGGRSVGDISNGGWRGHYQRGSTVSWRVVSCRKCFDASVDFYLVERLTKQRHFAVERSTKRKRFFFESLNRRAELFLSLNVQTKNLLGC